ncbi:MAG TPA: hypothetical protein VD928_01225, partial [Candidatus Paceibacterota bacterium]|nr:hypothetical protein [Candidatus Paceibacterota bacterium]
GNGKAVLGEIPGLFFLMVSLLALINLEKTQFREWRGYVFVGLTAGLCAVTKPFFLLFLGALGITLLIKWRSISLNWSGVAAGIVALLVPVVVWVFLQFGNDTSLSHILSDYANPYSVDLATQVLENTKRLVTETTPLYTLLLIVVWSVSLLIRKKKDISSAEIAGYVFSILAILSYLRLEGWYRYLFPATTIALVFFPAALQNIYTYVSTRLTQLTQLSWLPLAVILALSLGQFYESTVTSYVAQSYTSTRTRDVAQAFSVIDPNKTLYFYNTPELIIFSPSKNYYQYLSPLPKVIIGEDSLSSLKSGVVDMVFVHSDVFEQNSSLFESYKLSETIDRYILLQRK